MEFLKIISEFLTQQGAGMGLAVMTLAACAWLVRWVLVTTDKRELSLRDLIKEQAQTLAGQSEALNRITEKIDSMNHCQLQIQYEMNRLVENWVDHVK